METGNHDATNKNIPTKNRVLADQKHIKSCGYYALFEQATDAIMVTDFNGNFIDVNSSLCAMVGYTKNELLAMKVQDLLREEDLKIDPLQFDRLAKGENLFKQRTAVHKNGSLICVESNAKKCADGQILVITRNVTERIITEKILQKSEANLQTIFNSTDTIYVLMDKDLRIISLNTRAQEFASNELGHAMEINGYFLDYFSAEKRPVLLHNLKQVIAGKHKNYVVSYPQASNLAHWYNIKLFPICSGGDNMDGVMMAVSDITDKIRLEQKLEEERLKKQQEITDAVITAEENERHLIGQELHDNVNQLLATARLYLGIAKQKPGTENHQLIEKSLEFIDTSVNEIRNLSHSLISPFVEEYGLIQALDHLAGSVSKSGTITIDKKIQLNENALDDKLKLTIYRIVQEQFNNIIKYANATVIKISLTEDGDKITLTINDNGVGFDPSKVSTGIGLVNIKTRASLFSGKVDIISSPGIGCTIKVLLQKPSII